MSILIKGISMPKKCTVCNFGDALMGKGFCYISHCKQIEDYFVRNDRPTWCPLIELPPHGRLIDADALYDELEDYYKNRQGLERRGIRHCIELVTEYAPTIIESEGEEW